MSLFFSGKIWSHAIAVCTYVFCFFFLQLEQASSIRTCIWPINGWCLASHAWPTTTTLKPSFLSWVTSLNERTNCRCEKREWIHHNWLTDATLVDGAGLNTTKEGKKNYFRPENFPHWSCSSVQNKLSHNESEWNGILCPAKKEASVRLLLCRSFFLSHLDSLFLTLFVRTQWRNQDFSGETQNLTG